MKTVTRAAQQVSGLSIRTTNAAEADSQTQKIAPMWQAFMAQYGEHLGHQPLYGVYYDYQSDMNGEFSVMAAVANEALPTSLTNTALTKVTLAAGNYLCFSAKGEMPHTVFKLWQQIWAYFAAATCPYQRQYLTDFECYTSGESVDIYIGVHVEV